jgi:hypothetical protein
MSTKNATTTPKSEAPVSDSGRKTTKTKPEAAAAVDPVLKLNVARILTDLLESGDFTFEIPDEQIVAANKATIEGLKARIAELEKAAGVKPPATRADAAALAKTGKGGK